MNLTNAMNDVHDPSPEFLQHLEWQTRTELRRKERFAPPKPRKSAPPLLEESDDERHLEKLAVKVVGVSEALEKPYLRLTGPPDPEAIRPPRVL